MKLLRVHLARFISAVVPLCPGGCRQPITKPCTCTWLPPLPDDFDAEE